MSEPNEVLQEAFRRAEARLDAARTFLQEHDLVGLPVEQARELTRSSGIPFRSADADNPILSADMRPGRITCLVRDGLVVDARSGN